MAEAPEQVIPKYEIQISYKHIKNLRITSHQGNASKNRVRFHYSLVRMPIHLKSFFKKRYRKPRLVGISTTVTVMKYSVMIPQRFENRSVI